MVPGDDQNLIYNIKLSSVVPCRITGSDVVSEPNGVDLAMKLHYLKGVYFFGSQESQDMTITRIKESMFHWLNDYYMVCGRFRRSDTGRPYIKCNDCGVRVVEAQCDKTVDEWLELKDRSLDHLLVYHLPIGPELTLSPPLYVQITKFKCGGMCMGLSWAHILGDAFSVSNCVNMWSPFLAGLKSNAPLNIAKTPNKPESSENGPKPWQQPLSLKRVDPVGDHWVTASNFKMRPFSIHLTASQVSHLLSSIWGQSQINKVPSFESLCALMWQCVAKVREGHEPNIVTLCKKGSNYSESRLAESRLAKCQAISSVKADFPIVDSDLRKLATVLVDQAVNETNQIGELVEQDNGVSDYILYGANLTFVDLEEASPYGLEWNGHKPKFVHYTIQGVGDEGTVLLQNESGQDGNKGKIVTVILPETEVMKLKSELKKNGILLEGDKK
uniref:Uncharacterized protein MANES_03G144700 n=2 Tax=Rhizophora mucronata TaxID=61149 RepID=A0A2P2L8K0_RHIMU